MDLVKLIIERGGTSRSRPDEKKQDIARPRQDDALSVERYEWGPLYKVEEQPYYDMWKLLYEFDPANAIVHDKKHTTLWDAFKRAYKISQT